MTPSKPRISFRKPPLNEVVYSIQFESDVIDEVGILSRFYTQISSDYPEVTKQPPLPPANETFDQAPQAGIQFEMLPGPPTSRYWFVSNEQTMLVQVQADRIIFNWRQVQGDEEYPRFETLCPKFLDIFDRFVKCVDGVDPVPAWCELQYINPIPVPGDHPTHGQLARILNYLEQDPGRAVLPPVEDTQIQQRFRIPGPDGDPIGRLYVSAVPGVMQREMRPAYILTLLARGRPIGESTRDGIAKFFDVAHNLIVGGFAEVTTEEMHAIWEVEEVDN